MPATSTSHRGGTRATALPPQERRETIVAATIPLLLEVGEAVTTRQIAEAAGIAEGTIFRVFPDKEAVVSAAVASLLDGSSVDTDIAAIDPEARFEERLKAAVVIVQERTVLAWRVLSAVGPRYSDGGNRPLVDQPSLVALLSTEADRLRVDAAMAARTLRSLTLALTHPMLVPEPATASEITELFLHGVLAERAEDADAEAGPGC